MITIVIENIHDIIITTSQVETTISFRDRRGSDADIEMSRLDAEFLLQQLWETLKRK